MNTCHFDAALLDAYTEGDLFLDDMIQVQKHLDTCPDCQAYVDDLLAVRAAFPRVEDTVVPPDFTANVMAAVAAHPQATAVEASAETPAKPAKKNKTPWLRTLASLAACCAIVIAVQNLGGNKDTMAATTETKSESAVYEAQDAKKAAADTATENTSIAATSIEEETVSQEILSDASRTESGTDSTATGGSPSAEAKTSQYHARVILNAEDAGDFLDSYAPVLDVMSLDAESGTETREVWYELTPKQYAALADQLAGQGILPAVEVFVSDSETVLVIVQQEI